MKLLAFAAVAQVATSQFPGTFSFDTTNYQSASDFSNNYGNLARQQTSNFQGSPFAQSSGFANAPSTTYGVSSQNYGSQNNYAGAIMYPSAQDAALVRSTSYYGSQNNYAGAIMYPSAQNAAPVRSTSFSSSKISSSPVAQKAVPQRPQGSPQKSASSSPFGSTASYSPPKASYTAPNELYPQGGWNDQTASYSPPKASYTAPNELYPQGGWYDQVNAQAAVASYKQPVFSADYSTTANTANFAANSLALMSQPKPAQMYKSTFTELAPSKFEMKADDAGNEKIFNPLTVRRYNLVLSATDKAYLDNDPSKEEYVPCDITTDYGTPEAVTFYGAGCRYKGSLGSLMLCMDPETRKPSGGCRKLSWKVDSNKFRDDKQKINGQKKLIFNGMAVDTSLMSERVAYAAFAENNIPAPRSAHAELWVNGVHSGLFTTVESVDDRFGREFFGDDANKGEGALYKDLWIMPEHIKKIKDHHSDGKKEHKFVKKVIEEIMAVSESDAPAVLEKYFDTKSIVDVTALNTLIGQTDDWRIRHNFHWYVREGHDGSKKLVLIPWDFDRLNDGNARDVRAALGNWYAINDQADKCSYLYQSPEEKAASFPANTRDFQVKVYEQYPPHYGVPIQCDKISQVFAVSLRDRVKRRIKELHREMPASILENKINYIAHQIKAHVRRDPDWPEEELWQESYTEFKEFLQESRRQALQQASKYDPPVHFGPVTEKVLSKDMGFEMSSFNSQTPSYTPQSSFGSSSFSSSGTSWGSSPTTFTSSFEPTAVTASFREGTTSGSSPTTFSSFAREGTTFGSFAREGTTFGSSPTTFGSSSFGSFGASSFGRF